MKYSWSYIFNECSGYLISTRWGTKFGNLGNSQEVVPLGTQRVSNSFADSP